jgi:Arc/MetJ-type ribon-helix-helix transcriptional regulator
VEFLHGVGKVYEPILTSIIVSIIFVIILFILCRRNPTMPTRTVRTTVALPADLLAAVDQAVQAGHARSRNELVAMALQRELAAQQRAAIDAAFAAMAEDPAYQAEARAITDAFAHTDWEALRLAEGPTA